MIFCGSPIFLRESEIFRIQYFFHFFAHGNPPLKLKMAERCHPLDGGRILMRRVVCVCVCHICACGVLLREGWLFVYKTWTIREREREASWLPWGFSFLHLLHGISINKSRVRVCVTLLHAHTNHPPRKVRYIICVFFSG